MYHTRRHLGVVEQLGDQAGAALVRLEQLGVLFLLLDLLDDLAGQGVAVGGTLLGALEDLLHRGGVGLTLDLLLDGGRQRVGGGLGMGIRHHVDPIVELLAARGGANGPLGTGVTVLLDER